MIRHSILGAVGALLLSAAAAQAYPAAATADLNVRAAPTTSARVVGSIPRGTVVEVFNCGRGWCEIEFRGRTGFASERFLAAGVPPRAGGGGGLEIVIPFPGMGAPPPVVGRPGPGRPSRDVCNERRARSAIGERATRRAIDRAFDASGARDLRVVGPRDPMTRDFRRDRLTIEVDRRERIVNVSCG